MIFYAKKADFFVRILWKNGVFGKIFTNYSSKRLVFVTVDILHRLVYNKYARKEPMRAGWIYEAFKRCADAHFIFMG